MATKLKKIIWLFVGGVLLLGCTEHVERTNARIETTLESIEENLDRSRIPDLPESNDTVQTKNEIWLGNQSVKIISGDALPEALEKDDGITMIIAKEATLEEIARDLTDLTGIPVRLDDLKATDEIPTETVVVDYFGKLSGLLDYLSNRYSVWWRYKNGIITFFSKETRVFTIYALPTETSLSASLQGASLGTSGGAGSGNATSSLSTSANLALWDSIEEGVKQVVGEEGTLAFSRVSGTVTVTASPYMVAKVANYVASWNERLSRQVAISVKVLQVTLDKEDNYGLDLRAIFNSSKVSTAGASPYFIDSAVSGTAGAAGLLSMTLIDASSKWKDSAAIIQAISTQGKTSLVTSSSVTTLNNKVAPVQVSTAQNYVKQTTITTSGTGNDKDTELDIETDTLNYGFTMEILPRILDHGRLILLFTLTLSDLLALDTFGSAAGDGKGNEEETDDENDNSDSDSSSESTTVQLPKMQIRGFMQEIAMRSGSTLVLTGFERVQNATRESGVGRPKLSILGGQAYSQNTRDVLVILLTPEVLESPLSPEARMRDF